MAIGPGEGPEVVTMNQTQKSWIFEVICWPLRFTDSWPSLVSGSLSKKQLYHLFMATGSQGPQPWIKSAGRWQTSPSNRFPLRMRIEPLRLSSTIEFHDVEQTLRRSLFAQGFLRREIRLWLWIFHFISPRHKICVNFENLPLYLHQTTKNSDSIFFLFSFSVTEAVRAEVLRSSLTTEGGLIPRTSLAGWRGGLRFRESCLCQVYVLAKVWWTVVGVAC